jgi:hypothetical protein
MKLNTLSILTKSTSKCVLPAARKPADWELLLNRYAARKREKDAKLYEHKEGTRSEQAITCAITPWEQGHFR